MRAGETYHFPCGQWLDTGRAKKKLQTARELLPMPKQAKAQFHIGPKEYPAFAAHCPGF